MSDVAFGPLIDGVRFGIRRPKPEFESGSTVSLEVVCENRGAQPVRVFGFAQNYPRSLRVSPPKPHRPYMRVSFADAAVLHPPEAFVTVGPGEWAVTGLDLSFVFDRRGAGLVDVVFAYDPVRAGGWVEPFMPPTGVEALTGQVTLVITGARSLRENGVDERLEAKLDELLQGDDPAFRETLRRLGKGGLAFAARRVARIEASGVEASAGFRALTTLALLGPESLDAIEAAREDMPHAAASLRFADRWLRHRFGFPPPPEDMPFITALGQVAEQPAMRGNFLLVWQPYDLPIHGTRRVDLLGSGEAIVSIRPPGAPHATTSRTALTPSEMQGLLTALRQEGIWLFEPLRKVGLPDEPRPTLEIQLALGEPFVRRIGAWNGEWRQGPAAAVADYLDRMFDPTSRPSLASIRPRNRG